MNWVKDEYKTLSSKKIVVTGAAGFLGTHFVLNLLKQNATVIAADLNPQSLEKLGALVQTHSPQAQFYPIVLDLSQESAISKAAGEIARQHEKIDGLVNNAAITTSPRFYDSLTDFSLEEWNKGFSVTVDGTFLMLKHFLPLLSNTASIVNLGSIYGVVSPDQRIYEGSYREDIQRSINSPLVYSAAKGAVSMMTRYLAGFLNGKSIRVNTLIPGGVEREQNDEFKNKYSNRVPMQRMAKPEEIASSLLFLLSDSSTYITGQDFIVDGGLTAW